MASVGDYDKGSVLSLLPPELILKILDLAAASSKTSALALCLVSSWTYKLAWPRLLSTVTLAGGLQTREFMLMLLYSCKDGDNTASAALVRHLWLAQETSDLNPVYFPAISDLAITPEHIYYAAYWDARDSRSDNSHLGYIFLDDPPQSRTPLRMTLLPTSSDTAYYMKRLARDADLVFPTVLARTTHLSYALFVDEAAVRVVFDWAVPLLPLFTSLTHLAMSLPEAACPQERLQQFCANALARRPTLQALILVVSASARAKYTGMDIASLDSLHERWPRVYIMDAEGSPGDISADAWLEDARTGDDFWARAARRCAMAS
ncbi:hypothetical protein PLICRDRAFT_180493 [Plicaturopsis crispa FD-325 SS-3]|uniref:F-box domain-containing protein n=1 Tax=Plicaturopsis crispa FD-325 SS-3 TaxID=944288 RepID=A0A0C9SW12_PLICR|nr:hypothetical protein PLICRDRAFT_180493 [Plicaturopsis crispa FD-325 SS-3]